MLGLFLYPQVKLLTVKNKKNSGILDLSSNDLGKTIITGVSSTKGNELSLLESILDVDGDGSVIDDVVSMVLGGSKKKGGIGGLLGGLFGK